MLARKALAGTAGAPKLYVEDVMSCFLYTGTGATNTISNSIDLSGEGGLVWMKRRSTAANHQLYDTARGATKKLASNETTAEATETLGLTAFNSTGFTLGSDSNANGNGSTYASWTFRKAKKFFDVVTYTGNGSNRTISHNLGSVPGVIIVKRTDSTGNWIVYHRSLGATKYMVLEVTDSVYTFSTYWNDTEPTSTVFTVGTSPTVNTNGGTYVAYLFAHDAGGFGDAGSDNVISCGSYTGNGGTLTVNLGYEPQWILVKRSDSTSNWAMIDVMRGWVVGASSQQQLFANTSGAETGDTFFGPTATGFSANLGGTWNTNGGTYIYIAIRRGPMKTPTSGTSVFSPINANGSSGTKFSSNFPIDLQLFKYREGTSSSDGTYAFDRLRGILSVATGNNKGLLTHSTGAESDVSNIYVHSFDNTGFKIGSSYANANNITWNFRRAPGFFDVVCYTGNGTARTISHNLGVKPELMIAKSRSLSGEEWSVYHKDLGYTKFLYLNATNAEGNNSTLWDAEPTSSVFSVGTIAKTNSNGNTFVWYGFASLSGVSKVGSYTGTGALQTVNCGFTTGARFVLIKRTDSTGDWWVYDSARGISSGNDPYLFLNSTAAEVTNTNYVDTTSVGFQVTAAAPAGLNANGGTFIFLAVA